MSKSPPIEPQAATPRRTHAERSAATRQHLIATAIDVIQSKSFEEMSIHELARSAGVTSGAVQHHFESKAVLMMRVLSELIDSGRQDGQLWPAAALAPPQRAAQFVHAAWTLVYAQPRFIVAWNIYLGCRNQPEVLTHIAALRATLNAQMRAGFFDTFPELTGHADREAFLGLVFSTLRGLGLLQLFTPVVDGPAHKAAHIAQLECLAGLIAARCQEEGGGAKARSRQRTARTKTPTTGDKP